MENDALIYGAFIIKYVIDMIAPIIPAEKRRTIPWVALVF
jgi:hypothetical protein